MSRILDEANESLLRAAHDLEVIEVDAPAGLRPQVERARAMLRICRRCRDMIAAIAGACSLFGVDIDELAEVGAEALRARPDLAGRVGRAIGVKDNG